MNCWWVSNALGPFPALNYSKYSGYGSAYGANFIAPTSLISLQGYDALGNMKNFSSQEKAATCKTRSYLDNNFYSQFTDGDAGVTNTLTDTETLQGFITNLFNKAFAGQFNNPWNLSSPSIMNNDMFNIVFAEEIIKEYKPELLVVNMQDVDVCHANFTQYCNNLRKADFSVRHLWDTIQSTPGMANDTIMIVVPEHGRNLNPNTVIDAYGRYAVDHTSDQTSREIFCLVLGPPGKVVQNQVISTVTGQSIDVIPTIAKILGFDVDIPSGMLSGQPLNQALV
jgi:membrane-anchored protein YejM (alkaline phosphatase superfamily)